VFTNGGSEECCSQIDRTWCFDWERMRSDNGKPQMGEALVLKYLVCNHPLWLWGELGYEVRGENGSISIAVGSMTELLRPSPLPRLEDLPR